MTTSPAGPRKRDRQPAPKRSRQYKFQKKTTKRKQQFLVPSKRAHTSLGFILLHRLLRRLARSSSAIINNNQDDAFFKIGKLLVPYAKLWLLSVRHTDRPAMAERVSLSSPPSAMAAAALLPALSPPRPITSSCS